MVFRSFEDETQLNTGNLDIYEITSEYVQEGQAARHHVERINEELSEKYKCKITFDEVSLYRVRKLPLTYKNFTNGLKNMRSVKYKRIDGNMVLVE